MENKLKDIINYLDELFPNVGCELNYNSDFNLLIAVILSAQTTDASVNKISPLLFKTFPRPIDYQNASLNDIENIIKSIGLYKTKAKNIKNTGIMIHKKYSDKVPDTLEDLIKLPGVGRKTANVVLAEIFHIPAIAVDTHVSRVSKRLKLAFEKDTPDIIERKLKKKFPRNIWIKLHHQFIHFGRYLCTSRNPKCENCKLKEYCKYYKQG